MIRAVSGTGAPREAREHTFSAVAFVENLVVKELVGAYPGSRVTAHELRFGPPSGGSMFLYPFGSVVFVDVRAEERDRQLKVLHAAHPGLTTETVREDFLTREQPGSAPGMSEGVLVLDRLTPARVEVVALVVAQSAAMEYYERIVEQLFARTRDLVNRMESQGKVSLRTGRLHRFIGEAIGTRSEVLSVLHLLDKPDATWEDPAMDRIYGDLRDEFDLKDRYEALESKLTSIQEALELVLGVARDRRLVLLELAVVLLILFELAVAVTGHR
jgi:uncharacterized Rmd1/YagE family protein